MGLFNHFIMKIEDLEKRVKKRVEIKRTPSELGETFELRISHKQVEPLVERGYAVYYREIKSEWADRPIRSYFTEVKTEDLLKILPR